MYCRCGFEVVIRAVAYNGEAVYEIFDSEIRMISVCPDCGAKLRTPQDLAYSEPTEAFRVT